MLLVVVRSQNSPHHDIAMTRKHLVTRHPRKGRQQEGAGIGGTGEPHDPTNGGGDNHGENEALLSPSGSR
jgi:hypothetical protein